jgi:hypothetical protein
LRRILRSVSYPYFSLCKAMQDQRHIPIPSRREFFRAVGLLGTIGTLIGLSSRPFAATESKPSRSFRPIQFGIIADIHYDLTPGAAEHLEVFMKKVGEVSPDFIISLGDFAHAIPENAPFAKRFVSSKCPAYHVLGNHDMDRVNKKDATGFLGMPSPYYSFDIGGYHCVVIDPNNTYADGTFQHYDKGNYFQSGGLHNCIDDEQCGWLENDLRKTDLPVFLFSHQSLLHNDGGIPNRAYVQRILERENERSGFRKILACFNGHHHRDFYRVINGIHYFSINSVGYDWHEPIPGRYSDEARAKYPWIDHLSLYKAPLFCFVNIDSSGKLFLRGIQSEWATVPPDDTASASLRFGCERSPCISDRDVVL